MITLTVDLFGLTRIWGSHVAEKEANYSPFLRVSWSLGEIEFGNIFSPYIT